MKVPEAINRLLYFVIAFTVNNLDRTQAYFINRKNGIPVVFASEETAQFTWTFTGTYEVRWGLASGRDISFILVSISSSQQQGVVRHGVFSGVSGSYTLDSQNNKVATFNLTRTQTWLERLYGCALVSNGSISYIDYVYLQIRDPPSFTQSLPQTHSFSEGTSQSISCQARGRLDPQVQWLRQRDGKVMVTGTSEADISFPSFARAESGSYMCIAFNSQKTITAVTKLIALYKPEATNFTSNHFNHTAVEGQKVVLTCTSESNPTSRQKIYFNQYGSSTDSLLSNTSDTEYVISSVELNQRGKYTCSPYNSQGYGPQKSLFLTVNASPRIDFITSTRSVNERSNVDLSCRATGNPSPSLKWFKSGRVIGTGGSLTIDTVKRSDAGTYCCLAENGVGNSDQKFVNITVNYGPTLDQYKSTKSQKTWLGKTVQFSCFGDGVPTPTIEWRRPDGSVIGTNSNKLNITPLSDGDFGTYICYITNRVGNPLNHRIFLYQIREPKEPVLDEEECEVGARTLRIVWKTPLDNGGSAILSYVIQLFNENNDIVAANETKDTAFRFWNLQMKTNYRVELAAKNIVNVSRVTSWKGTTKIEGLPKEPVLDEEECEVGARTLRIVWKTPLDNGGSAILSYVIQLFNENNDIVAANETKDTAFRFWNLQMKTNYRVELAAKNIVNVGQVTSWKGTTKIEGKPGAPEVFLASSDQKDASPQYVTLLWQKPYENGSAIFMYSVYTQHLNTPTKSSASASASDSAHWENVVNTSSLRTSLIFSDGEDYLALVTAWNKFGESEMDRAKARQIVRKSISIKGSASENSGNKADIGTHMAYGFVIAALLVGCILFLVCFIKGYRRSGAAEAVSRTTDKSPSKVFTKAVIENEWAEKKDAPNKPPPKQEKRKRGHKTQSSRKPKHGTTDTTDSKATEERHYMSLIHTSNISENSDIRRQQKDVKPLPGKTARARDNPRNEHRSKDKADYMELIPGLRKTDVGSQKAQPVAKDDIYMTLLTEKQTNEILPEPIDKEKWEIPTANLLIDETLATGKFSEISKGRIRHGNGDERIVAVKSLKDLLPTYYKKGFMTEMEMMKSLKQHPNVIEFLGHVVSSEPIRIVMEYGDHGDLLSYLRSHRGNNDPYFREGKLQGFIVASKLLQFAKDVAKGMDYISSQNVVHLHLMASSVLVGQDETCKIGSFKLARLADDLEENTEAIKESVPAQWSAYETIMFGNYSTQSDVWSYGIVLFEIFTIGGCPYPKTTKDALREMLQKGERIPKPRYLDESVYKLMKDCWLEDPYERPEWEEIMDSLCLLEGDNEDHINLKTFGESKYHVTDQRLSTA